MHPIFSLSQILLNFEVFSNFITNKSTFNFEEALNNNKIIIFKFNKILMRESASEICRFIMSNIQTVAMKRFSLPPTQRAMTHCFLDEFQNFTSSDISEVLSESRKYKLFLCLSHQYLGQIESNSLKGSILSNCELKIVGMNSSSHLTAMARELNIDVKELFKLNSIGQFYLKRNVAEAFKFQASSYLVDMKTTKKQQSQWEQCLSSQLDKYYIPIDKNREIFTKVPTSINKDNKIMQDKNSGHYTKQKSNDLNSLLDSLDDEILDY